MREAVLTASRALLVSTLTLCITTTTGWSQSEQSQPESADAGRRVRAGARVGLGISLLTFDDRSLLVEFEDDKLSGQVDLDKKLYFGVVAGLTLAFDVRPSVTLETRFLYARQGSVLEGDGLVEALDTPGMPTRFMQESVFTLDYLNIPILARVTVSQERSHGYLGLGPQFGVLLNSKLTNTRSSQASGLFPLVEFESMDLSDQTEDVNVSILFVAGAELRGASVRGYFEIAFALGMTDVYTDSPDVRTRAVEFVLGIAY